jgi:hypothetical protein
MEIEVKGHSGCKIEIVNDGTKLIICKSTQAPSYMSRLQRQAEKQRDMSKTIYQHIRIPEIYSIDRSESTLSINMEYVYSKNFVDYFEDAGFNQIDYFVKALKIFIDSEVDKSEMKDIGKSRLLDKFEDVCRKIANNNCINTDDEVDCILKMSAGVFQALDNNMLLPVGVCHGDLTFSNILFNGNNYYLIDFLDSFVETPLMDLVKIRQDSCYAWSQLMYSHDLDNVRMSIISNKIDREIDSYYSRYTWYNSYYKAFQLMNFLRILQYAKEKKVIEYLKSTIKSML